MRLESLFGIVAQMVGDSIPQLKKLSRAKKRELIGELVDEVFGEPVRERVLSKALSARLEHFRHNPKSAKTWESVKARFRLP